MDGRVIGAVGGLVGRRVVGGGRRTAGSNFTWSVLVRRPEARIAA